MFRFFIVLLICICRLALYAEGFTIPSADEVLSSSSTPMANIDGEPSSFIHGCVNVITGDFVEQQTDLYLPGSDPLVLDRYYCSSDDERGPLFHGWHHQFWGALSQRCTAKHNRIVTKGGGGHYVFSERVHLKRHSKGYYAMGIDPKMMSKGITNCRGGEISGRTNIKNVEIEVPDSDAKRRKPYRWKLIDGAGWEHYYSIDKREEEGTEIQAYFLHDKTVKPTGETIKFLNSGYFTQKCSSQNREGTCTNSITFSEIYEPYVKKAIELGSSFRLKAKSEQGGKVKYEFTLFTGRKGHPVDKARYRLTKVDRSRFPSESYIYSEPNHDFLERVIRKERPDGRFLEIDYYKSGSKVARGKVKELKVPGPNGSSELLYRFEYKEKPNRGETHVFDAFNHKSIYHYCLETHRLLFIEKYQETALYTK